MRYEIEEVVLASPAELRVRTNSDALRAPAGLALFLESDPLRIPTAVCDMLDAAKPSALTRSLFTGKVTGASHVEPHPVLTSQQAAAVADGLADGVNVIWGPPGTGKTEVLGNLIAQLVLTGKSVLLASNTNVAVDEALLRADKHLGERPAGWLVRAGTPTHPAVNEHPSLRLEKAAAALGSDLRAKLSTVEERIAQGERDADAQLAELRVEQAATRLAELDVPAILAVARRVQEVAERDRVLAREDSRRTSHTDAALRLADAAARRDECARLCEEAEPATNARRALAGLLAAQAVADQDVADAEATKKERSARETQVKKQLQEAQGLGWRQRRRLLPGAQAELQHIQYALTAADRAVSEARQRSEAVRAAQEPQQQALLSVSAEFPPEVVSVRAADLVEAGRLLRLAEGDLARAQQLLVDASAEAEPLRDVSDLAEDELALADPELVREVEDLVERHERGKEIDHTWAAERTRQLAERKKILDLLDKQTELVVTEAKVLATTTATLVATPKMGPARARRYDMVIIDEASSVPLPVLAFLSTLATQGLTIVGDHRQNGPITTASSAPAALRRVLQQDIFTYLRLDRDGLATHPGFRMLDTQHRFPHEVAEAVNGFAYGGKLRSAPRSEVMPLPGLPSEAVVIVDVSDLPEEFLRVRGEAGKKAGAWLAGVAVTANLARRLDSSVSLGVVVPYAKQATTTQEELHHRGLAGECGTSHRFQGREFDTVVLDTVDPSGHRGWLWHARFNDDPSSWAYGGARVANVALTRTKGQVFVIADTRSINTAPAGSFYAQLLAQRRSEGVGCVRASELLGLPAADTSVDDDELEQILSAPPPTTPPRRAAPDPEVLTAREMYAALPRLTAQAAARIEVRSPYVTGRRLRAVLPHLQSAVARGVDVVVYCKPSAEIRDGHTNSPDALGMLSAAGVRVVTERGMHEKLVLLDSVGYFGSLNLLSFGGRTRELMMRVEGEAQLRALSEAAARD